MVMEDAKEQSSWGGIDINVVPSLEEVLPSMPSLDQVASSLEQVTPSCSLDQVAPSVGRLRDELLESFRSRQALLLAAERELRDHLWGEYRAQIAEVEPTLRLRGEMVGQAMVDAVMGSGSSSDSGPAPQTYGEMLAASLKDTAADTATVREALAALDPLITPVLDPFVEGLQRPLNQAVGEVKAKLLLTWAGTGLACGVAGFLLGRLLPRDRKGG